MEIFSSYTGSDFLFFYAVMLVTCVFAGLWIPANLRDPGERGEVTKPEEMAVLAGGQSRHLQAVVVDLMARGALAEGTKGKLRVERPEVDTGSAGRALLRRQGEFDLRQVAGTSRADATDIERKLIQRGLLMDVGNRMRLRGLSVLPYIALLGLGFYRLQAGEALGEPTGFLAVLLALTALFAAIRVIKTNPRTMGGNETLRDAETRAARMRSAPTANEAGYAVAIFGTGVLVGTPWESVHAMRQGGSGGDGSSSDGDGGGGCGGGCGGCGG